MVSNRLAKTVENSKGFLTLVLLHHFRIKIAVAAMAEKCDITICRDSTGSPQTFTLRPGGVLRIGRGVANDVVLDFDGVSVYHAEIHLPKDGPLCIRDESRNGTAVRPGPHAEEQGVTAWEPLKKSQLRILPHGWQILMPLNSRRNTKQLVVSARLLSIFMGTKVPPMPGQEPATFPLRTQKVFSAGAAVRRNVKALPAVKMEEDAMEEPELRFKRRKKKVDDSDAEPKRKKKKKEKKRKAAEEDLGEVDEEELGKKKGKSRVKEQESEEGETEAQRKEREELLRLERELEDELAEETRKIRREAPAPQAEAPQVDSANFDGSATYRDAESSAHPATEGPDDEDEAADDAETQRVLQKAMAASAEEDQANEEPAASLQAEVEKEVAAPDEVRKEPEAAEEPEESAVEEQDLAAWF